MLSTVRESMQFGACVGAIAAGVLTIAPVAGAQGPPAHPDPIPIVDVHNQYDGTFPLDRILTYMDQYGIGRMIVAPAAKSDDESLLAFGQRHRDRLTIAVRSKVPELIDRQSAQSIVAQARREGYGGIEEILIWHQDKGGTAAVRASQVEAHQASVDMGSAAVGDLVAADRARGWPFVAHIEFAGAGDRRGAMMSQFETLLDQNPDVWFGLIHRGQLDAPEARALLEKHANLFIILSHSTEQPAFGFTPIFHGNQLNADWRALIVAHPDRFVLSFDEFSGLKWRQPMAVETAAWRSALPTFPVAVANAVAHENAERLWHLPPTVAVKATGATRPAVRGQGKRGGQKGKGGGGGKGKHAHQA